MFYCLYVENYEQLFAYLLETEHVFVLYEFAALQMNIKRLKIRHRQLVQNNYSKRFDTFGKILKAIVK
jgi:hypothetical protein